MQHDVHIQTCVSFHSLHMLDVLGVYVCVIAYIGTPVIIENLGEEIDATLDPVLARAVIKCVERRHCMAWMH